MTVLLPQHYALTEALVAAAGAIAMVRTARTNPWFAIGLLPFALAGLVGAIRISAGLAGAIEIFHQLLSRPGALFGLGCLVGTLAGRAAWLPPVVGLTALALAVLAPAISTAVFVVLILSGSLFAYQRRPETAELAAASFALLLVGRLATDPLRLANPALAWHMFHLAVALWLWLLAAIVLPQPVGSRTDR